MTRPRIKVINHYTRDRSDDRKTLTVVTKADEGNIRKLLEHIRDTAAGGHSFSVVVDPGDTDYERKFGFDGDGAFRIESIKSQSK
jgi:hypothetical protein